MCIYLELSHLPPSDRLAAAAVEWRSVRGTPEASKFIEGAQSCKKLCEVDTKVDESASVQLGAVLRKKMMKLVNELSIIHNSLLLNTVLHIFIHNKTCEML